MLNERKDIKLSVLTEREPYLLDFQLKKEPINVFEAFCGIGAQHIALQILSKLYPWFKFQVVGISEINKDAIKIYQGLFGEKISNFGDIKEIQWENVPDFDLFTYSFPCKNISLTGDQTGFKKGSGTESALLWECEKPIQIKKPKFLLLENVKNILAPKFSEEFNDWYEFLEAEGYKSSYGVLDAQDFGVPQHRERFFMVSILGDEAFTFPAGVKQQYNTSAFLNKNIRDHYRKAS